MDNLYKPKAYFDRLDDLFIAGRIEIDRAWQQYASQRPWLRRCRHLRLWLESAVLVVRLLSRTPDRTLRTIYRQRIWRFLQMRRNPTALRVYAIKCAVHYHMYQLARALQSRAHPIINTY
jgi:hypothetical protein